MGEVLKIYLFISCIAAIPCVGYIIYKWRDFSCMFSHLEILPVALTLALMWPMGIWYVLNQWFTSHKRVQIKPKETNNSQPTRGEKFPTSPKRGQLFYRTDLKLHFLYNGNIWIPTHMDN